MDEKTKRDGGQNAVSTALRPSLPRSALSRLSHSNSSLSRGWPAKVA